MAVYLESKPRYEILDGLRGVAAVLVVFCVFLVVMGIAYAPLKLFDEPVREWLKRKLFIKK